MDVHKEAVVIAVLNSSGKLVMESIVETKASKQRIGRPSVTNGCSAAWGLLASNGPPRQLNISTAQMNERPQCPHAGSKSAPRRCQPCMPVESSAGRTSKVFTPERQMVCFECEGCLDIQVHSRHPKRRASELPVLKVTRSVTQAEVIESCSPS
jgi:hypothetical protein